MLNMSRGVMSLSSAGLAAALGLNSRLSIVRIAARPSAPDAGKGFRISTRSGPWRSRPSTTAFGKSRTTPPSSRTPASTTPRPRWPTAGMTTDYVPIPLTVIVLKIGDKTDHGRLRLGRRSVAADRRSALPDNMKAAGIDPG